MTRRLLRSTTPLLTGVVLALTAAAYAHPSEMDRSPGTMKGAAAEGRQTGSFSIDRDRCFSR